MNENIRQPAPVRAHGVNKHLISEIYDFAFIQPEHFNGFQIGLGFGLRRIADIRSLDVFHKPRNAFFVVIGKQKRPKTDILQFGKQRVNFRRRIVSVMNKRVVNVENKPPKAFFI